MVGGRSIRKVENLRLSVSCVKGLQQMCSHPFVHTDEEMGVSLESNSWKAAEVGLEHKLSGPACVHGAGALLPYRCGMGASRQPGQTNGATHDGKESLAGNLWWRAIGLRVRWGLRWAVARQPLRGSPGELAWGIASPLGEFHNTTHFLPPNDTEFTKG